MEEYLDIFDENMQHIGVATRKEVHKKGYWHQTFHCWVVLLEEEQVSIVFQKRHPQKETFPNKLDISAAGHLLQGESVVDGVRELEEELGIHVDYSELMFLGTYKGSYLTDTYKDQEFTHAHLLKTNRSLTDFSIQQTELKGLYQFKWDSFLAFLQGSQTEIEALGFEYNDHGDKEEKRFVAVRNDFADQADSYYQFVFEAISKVI